jgi:hypothetical protein
MVALLYRHAVFLADPKNYSQYNHGIMMDKSLLLLSLLLRHTYPDAANGWFDLAAKRIQIAFERDYTPSMVHVENSPSYHFYVTEHFQEMAALMEYFKIEPPAGLGQKLAQAGEFSRCVTMPNRRVPMIGDTGRMDAPFASSLTSRVFEDAGILIGCSPAPKPADSTWLLFKSGYLTHTHKHADDLSFVLYARGREVFVDGGLLNYDTKDPFAIHLNSALAHNTLVVDGQSYQIRHRALDGSEPPPWKMFPESGLLAGRVSADGDMARGYNAAYPGASLERTIVFLKPDVVILYDVAESAVSHRYTQIFRVGNEFRVARLDPRALVLADTKDTVSVALVQLMGESAEVRTYCGDREMMRGWGAAQFDQLVPVPQVEFTRSGNRAEFLTMIGVGRQESALRRLAGEMISIKPNEIDIHPAKGDAQVVKRGLVRPASR